MKYIALLALLLCSSLFSLTAGQSSELTSSDMVFTSIYFETDPSEQKISGDRGHIRNLFCPFSANLVVFCSAKEAEVLTNIWKNCGKSPEDITVLHHMKGLKSLAPTAPELILVTEFSSLSELPFVQQLELKKIDQQKRIDSEKHGIDSYLVWFNKFGALQAVTDMLNGHIFSWIDLNVFRLGCGSEGNTWPYMKHVNKMMGNKELSVLTEERMFMLMMNYPRGDTFEMWEKVGFEAFNYRGFDNDFIVSFFFGGSRNAVRKFAMCRKSLIERVSSEKKVLWSKDQNMVNAMVFLAPRMFSVVDFSARGHERNWYNRYFEQLPNLFSEGRWQVPNSEVLLPAEKVVALVTGYPKDRNAVSEKELCESPTPTPSATFVSDL